MRGLLHDFGARVVIFINAMSKTHQAERIVLVLGLVDIFGNAVHRANFGQHLQGGLIGASMRGTPQAGNASGNAGERIGAGRAGQSDG